MCSWGHATESDVEDLLQYFRNKGVDFSTVHRTVDYFSTVENRKYELVEKLFLGLVPVFKQAQKDGYDQLIALTKGIRDGVALTSMHFLATIGQAASAWEEAKANRPIETSDPAKSLPIVTCERDPKLLELS